MGVGKQLWVPIHPYFRQQLPWQHVPRGEMLRGILVPTGLPRGWTPGPRCESVATRVPTKRDTPLQTPSPDLPKSCPWATVPSLPPVPEPAEKGPATPMPRERHPQQPDAEHTGSRQRGHGLAAPPNHRRRGDPQSRRRDKASPQGKLRHRAVPQGQPQDGGEF